MKTYIDRDHIIYSQFFSSSAAERMCSIKSLLIEVDENASVKIRTTTQH